MGILFNNAKRFSDYLRVLIHYCQHFVNLTVHFIKTRSNLILNSF